MIGQVITIHGPEGLMDVGIKLLAYGRDRGDLQLAQDVFHLLNNELDAGTELVRGAGGFEGQFKVVEYGQKLLYDVSCGVVAKVGAFSFAPLASVFKLGLQASEAIDELVALGLDFVEFVSADGFFGSRSAGGYGLRFGRGGVETGFARIGGFRRATGIVQAHF